MSFCRGAGQEVGRSCIILEFKGRKIMVITSWMDLSRSHHSTLGHEKMLQVKSSSPLKSAQRGRFCSFLEQYSIYDSRHYKVCPVKEIHIPNRMCVSEVWILKSVCVRFHWNLRLQVCVSSHVQTHTRSFPPFQVSSQTVTKISCRYQFCIFR